MCLKFVICSWFLLGLLVSGSYCENITIDLKNNVPHTLHSIYKNFETISNINTTINVKNINENIGYFIIQVHTFFENVTLSYGAEDSHYAIEGTNIGLVYGDSDPETTFYLYRSSNQTVLPDNVTVLVVIVVYDEEDPVPGGCNLTFDTIIAPYQIVTYTRDIIMVSSQPPSGYGVSCDHVSDKITVDHYHMFLKEHDNNSTAYFDALLQMLTVDDIRTFGRKVSPTDEYFTYQRLFSNYKSTGEVFAIVVTYGNKSAAYVPAVSYGCDITRWNEDCYGPASSQWKFIYVLLIICGLLLCFMGHIAFKVAVTIIGCGFGFLISHVIFSNINYFKNNPEGNTSIALTFAILVAIAWLKVWTKCAIPILTVTLSFFMAGMLLSSAIFYAGLADLNMFNNNINYWTTFFGIILAASTLCMLMTVRSHIFACSFLGAYACIYAMNYHIGGNLQYILTNTYRRIVVKNFNMAEIAPPFQLLDIIHVIVWPTLLILGFTLQAYLQKFRPPFPQPRIRGPWHFPVHHDEHTPLLFH